MARTALMIETGCRIGPEPSRAVGHTFVIMQIYDIDGVDVCTSSAVRASQIARSTVHIAEPALELSEILILAIRALCCACGSGVFQKPVCA